MTLRIKIQVSREGEKDDRGYGDDLASFQTEADDASVWEVYRGSVAALTPEADKKHWVEES